MGAFAALRAGTHGGHPGGVDWRVEGRARAGYLPEPASSEVRSLLREYVPLRIIGTADLADVRVRMARSAELQTKLWSIAEDLARTTPESEVLALFIASLNETIDLHETRVVAGLYARVPETIILLLFSGTILTLGLSLIHI